MNYTGSHPLNLIGKVAIVTSASTATGAAICRSLLNSNAFVLGVDVVPAHESTKCGRGSHFQFYQLKRASGAGAGEGGGDWSDVLKYAREMYWKDEVDFFVRIVRHGNDGVVVPEEVLDVMRAREDGLVVFVGCDESVDGEVVIDAAQDLEKRLNGSGVRCNAVVTARLPSKMHLEPELAELLDHIEIHNRKRKEGGYAIDYAREMANLCLYLCTSEGVRLGGMAVAIDGTCALLSPA